TSTLARSSAIARPAYITLILRLSPPPTLALVPYTTLFRSPSMKVNLAREAEKRGVAPERVVFAPRIDPPEHLARHRLADLFLDRSEEHTSELQSHLNLVCRLLLEKKKVTR